MTAVGSGLFVGMHAQAAFSTCDHHAILIRIGMSLITVGALGTQLHLQVRVCGALIRTVCANWAQCAHSAAFG